MTGRWRLWFRGERRADNPALQASPMHPLSHVCRFALCGMFALGHCLAGANVLAEASRRTVEQIVPLVEQHCGSCHPVPRPDVMPKSKWPLVVNSMAEVARQRAGKEVMPPDVVRDISALYYGSSPETLPRLPVLERSDSDLEFFRRDLGASASLPITAGTICVVEPSVS